MARARKTASIPKSPGQALGPYYQPGGAKETLLQRFWRVLLWAIIVAIVAAIVAYVTIQSGGASLPAGMAMGKYLLIQAGVGFAEGLLYGTLSEVMGNKQAQGAIQAMTAHQSQQLKVERISQQQMEAELRQSADMRQKKMHG